MHTVSMHIHTHTHNTRVKIMTTAHYCVHLDNYTPLFTRVMKTGYKNNEDKLTHCQ